MRSIVPLFVFALAASAPALAAETVPVPPFRSIELHGGGIMNIVPGPVQRVTLVEGSTQFTRVHVERDGKLVIDACDQRCPRNYQLRIQVESPHVLGIGLNGGGLVNVAGGSALGATVNGGGEIVYWGNPTVASSIHGGGAVRQGR
jgi:hypothetical protein